MGTSSRINFKLVAGVVPIAVAVGYLGFSNYISNETVLGVADKIRKEFEEGDALSKEQQEKFADEQQRLRNQKEDKEIAKIEKQQSLNTKNAGGLDSTDPASDSETREVASKNWTTIPADMKLVTQRLLKNQRKPDKISRKTFILKVNHKRNQPRMKATKVKLLIIRKLVKSTGIVRA